MERGLPQITRLLILGVTSIVALNFIALLVAYGGYSTIRFEQSEFNSSTLPLAGRARTLATSADDLVNKSAEVTSRTDVEELDTLDAQIAEQVEIIRHELGESLTLDHHRRLGNADSSSILIATPDVEEVLSGLVQSGFKQRKILAQKRELSSVIDGVRKQIADLRLKLTAVSASRTTNARQRDLWRELIGAIGPWEARYLLLKDVASEEAIDGLLIELQAELRGAALAVSRLPNSGAREEIAGQLLPLLLSGSESNGPFARAKKLAIDRAALGAELVQIRAKLVLFRDQVNLINNDLRSSLAASMQELMLTTRNMERGIAGLCLLSLIGGVWFVHRFVMRGLGAPLTLLAEKTHQLAQGDFDIEPSKARVREFDLIERALTVFADNSAQLRSTRDELAGKNLSLQQSLEDLERFSYAASHDLRSPLRGIDTLASFIRQDLGANISAEVGHNLDRMRKRIESLELLLEDLLAYSRASQIEPGFTEVDIKSQVDAALEMLDVQHQVTVTYALEVEGLSAPQTLIFQVIRNIIDNAIKHHPSRVLRLERADDTSPISLQVRSARREQTTLVEFSDDGDGVPERYFDRVVGLFETLERKSHTGGSGLGLPLIRKLLRQYGGDVELGARSDGHSGLVVTIHWPDAAERHADSLSSTPLRQQELAS